MNRLLMGSLACVASLSAGCLTNGTVDGEMVMKCYYDQTVSETLEDGTTNTYIERTVYNEFTYDLSPNNPDAIVVGRINTDNELQFTAIVECDEDCRVQCGAPPITDSDGEAVAAPGPIDLERLTVHVVAGRQELAGVPEEDWPLYSPAYYYARGYAYDSAGNCLTGDELEDNFDVRSSPYGDPMGYSIAQLNTNISANYAGRGYYNADNGCLHAPWASMTVDDPTLVERRGDISGTVHVADLEIVGGQTASVLIDIHATGDRFSPATFTIDGLLENTLSLETVVTKNNDPYDIGL